MAQLLRLLKKGDHFAPTSYQFGANEHLNIHRSDDYADLTNAKTGSCIRIIGWDGVRNMGYCPIKLLKGNTSDQHLSSVLLLKQLRECAVQIAGGVAVAVAIAVIGSVTGCTSYMLDQIEQDVATSTIGPRLAQSNTVNQDDLDDDAIYFASEQYRDAKYANRKLSELYATGGIQ